MVGAGTINSPKMPLHVYGASQLPALSVPGTYGVFSVAGTINTQLDIGENPNSPYGTWLQAHHSTAVGAYSISLNPLGGNIAIGNLNPLYALDVVGDCNVTGAFRINGVALATSSGPTTAAYLASGSRALNATYTNNYGKPLYLQVTYNIPPNSNIMLWISGNPTSGQGNGSGSTALGTVFGIVLPGQTYQLQAGGSAGSFQGWTEWY
jgi:hypothetical protein